MNLADALRTLRTHVFNSAHGDRKEAHNIVVLITDGESNLNSQRTVKEARNNKEAGKKTCSQDTMNL